MSWLQIYRTRYNNVYYLWLLNGLTELHGCGNNYYGNLALPKSTLYSKVWVKTPIPTNNMNDAKDYYINIINNGVDNDHTFISMINNKTSNKKLPKLLTFEDIEELYQKNNILTNSEVINVHLWNESDKRPLDKVSFKHSTTEL